MPAASPPAETPAGAPAHVPANVSGRQPPRVGVVFRPELPPERLRDYVTAAEAGGLDDVWLWEDCFREGGLTMAAAALAWTSSVRVGVGLMPVPFRNPALAAMEIATLARLFPGRFAPGVGHGVLSWNEQVGVRAASPMTLLREWVTAVRALLAGQTVSTSGEYVRLDKVALDWPPPAVPPLLVGARGPKTVALGGELADGLILDVPIDADGVRQAVATAAAPRPHDVVVYLLSAAGPDAAERVGAELAESGKPPAGRSAVGSPADVAAAIRSFADAGATTVVLQPTAEDPDVLATISLAAAARAALHAGSPA
jgi:alkanesulfonate monooxygenase SsuD/methylene tetrahydromethanopterin reductase-like flavin-dependent oxidoreductase (luciferase family)